MERLARLVMHHRRIVSALWLALFIGGLFSAGALSNRWTLDFSLPGQPGDRAEQQLIKTYGVSTYDTYVAVVTVPEGRRSMRTAGAVAGSSRPPRGSSRPAAPGRRPREHRRPGLRD